MRINKEQMQLFKLLNLLFLVLVVLILIFVLPKVNQTQIANKQTSQSPNKEDVFVVRVIDGDTFVDSKGRHIRLIGVDAPEMNYKKGKPECMALEAKLFLQEKVLHKKVILESDKQDKDKYKRPLRYVYLDSEFINKELVEKGLAEAKSYPPNTKYQNVLNEAEARARKARAGIYSNKCANH